MGPAPGWQPTQPNPAAAHGQQHFRGLPRHQPPFEGHEFHGKRELAVVRMGSGDDDGGHVGRLVVRTMRCRWPRRSWA